MQAAAHHRIAHGQKALSLDIRWMRNIGIIAETGAYQRQRQAADDMQPIEDTDLFALLTVFCDPTSSGLATPQGQSQVLFGLRTPADALAEGKPVPALLDRPLFAPFSFIVGGSGTPPQGSAYDNSLTAAAVFRTSTDSGERSQAVVRALAAKLARAMAISPGDVEPSKPLSSYGVDSLMVVELRNWIKREFGTALAIFEIMDGVPIANIAHLVSKRSLTRRERCGSIQSVRRKIVTTFLHLCCSPAYRYPPHLGYLLVMLKTCGIRWWARGEGSACAVSCL
jgi:acyl carrier protein